MKRKGSLVRRCILYVYNGLMSIMQFFTPKSNSFEMEDSDDMKATIHNGIIDDSIKFSERVLDEFRRSVGRYWPETGGMLASTQNSELIDKCHFDTHSQNTPGTFYYDVETMSKVFRAWKSKGYITNGIYHSHPKGAIHPSYHDISTALLHINFFGLDYFYLPIFQPDRKGFYTLYFYVVRKVQDNLEVNLNYVLKATQDGYEYIPFRAWKRCYPIEQLNAYRKSIEKAAEADRATTVTEKNESNIASSRTITITTIQEDENMSAEKSIASTRSMTEVPVQEYFKKVTSLYPDNVLDKVIVCIGTGGARSFLENCARSGFRNYILMDADVVSPSNIATQGVFISEMGKKKVEIIRDRIMDINPRANVICVDKFLDDRMSDEEFKWYMNKFQNKKPTDYLILGCTDNFEAQKRSSLLALKYGTPYLAAMMYEAGAAAEIIFVYPGVTESCPRCLLRDRFEKYENGFVNDVDSSSCPIFATERMNSLKGYIALMLLMYHEDSENPFSRMLDDVKNRNFVEIRLNPYLKDSKLGIGLFDRVFADASRYVYFDETLWIPQHPDRSEFGSETCKLCGGTGDLTSLQEKWKYTDTRGIRFDDTFGDNTQ